VIPVVADGDTLFGGTTRGLLIHLDYLGMIRPLGSHQRWPRLESAPTGQGS
jgi:hypothetical protein